MNGLKELSSRQIVNLERAIQSYLNRNTLVALLPTVMAFPKFKGKGSKERLDAVLGLAYTSSSAYAGLWVCNIALYVDAERKYSVTGFGVEANSYRPFMLCNHEETEASLYIYI